MHAVEPDTLEIEAEQTPGGCVLHLRGELDLASTRTFEVAIARMARPGTTLELDLDGLTFVDSTGMRGIIAAKQLCEARSCELVLTRPSPRTRRLFEFGRLLQRLPFRGEVER